MEVIACPNCGKLLQYDTRKENFMIDCPKCGEVPLLEDSQVITISEGKLCGPGLKNLEDKAGEEMLIYEGKTSQNKIHEESVIEGFQGPTIKMDSRDRQSLNPMNNAAFKAKIPTGTVEEKYDFEYKSNQPSKLRYGPKERTVKRGSSPKTQTPNASLKKQERALPPKVPRPVYNKKTPPWQHFALFYGTIGIVLLTLIIVTVYKYTRPPREVIVHNGGAPKLWNQAENDYREGELYYQEASYNRANKQQYMEKLKLSQACYQKALEMGKQSWQQHIQDLIQKENMSAKEAEEYALINHGGYQQKMQKWQQEYKKIEEEIALLEKEKK